MTEQKPKTRMNTGFSAFYMCLWHDFGTIFYCVEWKVCSASRLSTSSFSLYIIPVMNHSVLYNLFPIVPLP